MRTVQLILALVLTSLPSGKNRHPHAKHELRSSNDREPDRDRDVFHRHGVYPVPKFLGINTRPLNDENGPKPESQHDLCEEGANGENEEGVPRSFFASVFTGACV